MIDCVDIYDAELLSVGNRVADELEETERVFDAELVRESMVVVDRDCVPVLLRESIDVVDRDRVTELVFDSTTVPEGVTRSELDRLGEAE